MKEDRANRFIQDAALMFFDGEEPPEYGGYDDEPDDGPDEPVTMSLVDNGVIVMARAPAGGATINGKEYKGGMFIPGDEIAQASTEELEAAGIEVEDKAEAGTDDADADSDGDSAAPKKKASGVKVPWEAEFEIWQIPKDKDPNTDPDLLLHEENVGTTIEFDGVGGGVYASNDAPPDKSVKIKVKRNKKGDLEFRSMGDRPTTVTSGPNGITISVIDKSGKTRRLLNQGVVGGKLGAAILERDKKNTAAKKKTAKKSASVKRGDTPISVKNSGGVATVTVSPPKGNFPDVKIEISDDDIVVTAESTTGKGAANPDKLANLLWETWSQPEFEDLTAAQFAELVGDSGSFANNLMNIKNVKPPKGPPKKPGPKPKATKKSAPAADAEKIRKDFKGKSLLDTSDMPKLKSTGEAGDWINKAMALVETNANVRAKRALTAAKNRGATDADVNFVMNAIEKLAELKKAAKGKPSLGGGKVPNIKKKSPKKPQKTPPAKKKGDFPKGVTPTTGHAGIKVELKNATTVTAIQKTLAKNKNLKNTKFHLTGASVAGAKKIANKMSELSDSFPMTMSKLPTVSMNNTKSTYAMVYSTSSTGDTASPYNRFNFSMVFSKKHYGKKGGGDNAIKRDYKTKWCATDTMEGVVAHEFGHMVHFTMKLSNVNRFIQTNRPSKNPGDSQFLSSYATKNSKETFAEAFGQMAAMPKTKWTAYTKEIAGRMKRDLQIEGQPIPPFLKGVKPISEESNPKITGWPVKKKKKFKKSWMFP